MATQLRASVAYPAIVAGSTGQQDHPVAVGEQDLEVALLGRHDIATLRPCRPDQQVHVAPFALRARLLRVCTAIGMERFLIVRLVRVVGWLFVTWATSHWASLSWLTAADLGLDRLLLARLLRAIRQDASQHQSRSCAPTAGDASPVAALGDDPASALGASAGTAATPSSTLNNLLNATDRHPGGIGDLPPTEAHFGRFQDRSIALQTRVV